MRLTQIKLAGFKSFVDPTSIATPGQLVGIVGPNGCGKSNVIDAVRWVLGESKASALRGESMQDVIFNGAGDRAPVGRASVELYFDNSQGRIGGQWGSFAELSIKRVLTRDGDSTYYINNIPVRRRDIHDLFLGTGLGPRAYAIIEQGMIARVIEARPEELRVFLEEAAGVSKYRERRRETESRIADTRENLSRVEDIRVELGAQLARLDAQAKVATEYRDLESRHKQAQHLLWFAKQQDAVRARERQASGDRQPHVGLRGAAGGSACRRESPGRLARRSLQGRRRTAREARRVLRRQRRSHASRAAAGVRARERRPTGAAGRASHRADRGLHGAARRRSPATRVPASRNWNAPSRSAKAPLPRSRPQPSAVPQLEAAVADAARAMAAIQRRIGEVEQELRVADTQRENAAKVLGALAQRRERLEAETRELALPTTTQIDVVTEQLEQETADLDGPRQGTRRTE